MLTGIATSMGWQCTSIQVNILDAAEGTHTGVNLHRDQYNHPLSHTHLLVLGSFSGGQFWLEDPSAEAGVKPPSYLCSGKEPSSGVQGCWHDLMHGQWIRFDPTAWHGTSLVTQGTRMSYSFFLPAGLHRVSTQTWSQLQCMSFPAGSVAFQASRTLQSLAAWTSRRMKSALDAEGVLEALENNPPFSLQSGLWHQKDCMWLALPKADEGTTHQTRWRQSALSLQTLGFVAMQVMCPQIVMCLCCCRLTPIFRGVKTDSGERASPWSQEDRIARSQGLCQCGSGLRSSCLDSTPGAIPTLEEEELDPADDPDEDEGNGVWEPTEAELKSLQLAHNNLGHPINADFCRLLRRGGARAEVVRWTMRH
eukprot:1583588-Amphidinium_carterae.1